MICRECHSLNFDGNRCRDCGTFAVGTSNRADELATKPDGLPLQMHDWVTRAVTFGDVLNIFVVVFVALWTVASLLAGSLPWEVTVLTLGAAAVIASIEVVAVVGPARHLTIDPDGNLLFERRRFHPRQLTVNRGELFALDGSLLDINRFRPMVVRTKNTSMTYIPPRDEAIEIFRMIRAANPHASVSNPTPIYRRERL
jgi:hypothetical protein